jgi:hypothetical protein
MDVIGAVKFATNQISRINNFSSWIGGEHRNSTINYIRTNKTGRLTGSLPVITENSISALHPIA